MTSNSAPPTSDQTIAKAGDDREEQRLRAAQRLEAMRLGVVPASELEASTVGRELELEMLSQDLKACANSGARRAFLGDYGLGKTHMLELLQSIALKNNFLVARAILDHNELSPAQPKRVYYTLMSQLRYPDRPHRGLDELLKLAISKPASLERFKVSQHRLTLSETRDALKDGYHLYLSPALSYYQALQDEKKQKKLFDKRDLGSHWIEEAKRLLLAWLEGQASLSNQDLESFLLPLPGRYPKLYSLLDFRPWAKIYGYLLSGISTLARSVGYNGLVVVIDEAEFYALLSSENRLYAKSLFQAWSYAAGGQRNSYLPFRDGELLTGGFGIQREVPARYCDDPSLYLVFAMTPNQEGLRVLYDAIPAQAICYLNPLSAPDYLKMTKHVIQTYCQSCQEFEVPEQLASPLAQVVNALSQQGLLSNPRQTVKFLVDFLDIVRYAPEQLSKVIEEILAEDDF